MRKEDFRLSEVDRSNGHIDYWFYVDGETEKELTDKYREQCMVGVTGVVYSEDEDIVGIERQFYFNYDVVISDDDSLKEMLKSIAQDIKSKLRGVI